MLKSIIVTVSLFFLSCDRIEKPAAKNNGESNHSVTAYWKDFQKNNREYAHVSEPQSFFFCDNKKDADECAELIVQKIKQATSPSVWWFKKNNEPFPETGDIAIVTNWDGEPKAIIRTTKIEIVKFKDITPKHANIEGEGDKTLEYWKKSSLGVLY